MIVATKKQMNELDALAIKDYGIPSLLLMDKAASRVYDYLINTPYQSVTIIAGTGNNGGDGLALARQLFLWSTMKVEVIIVGDISKISEDASIYYKMCKSIGVPIGEKSIGEEEIKSKVSGSDVIVDALFGTGLSKNITGEYKAIIEYCNGLNAHKVSVDIPSGIACDTGQVLGVAFRADVTLTFEYVKVGMYLYPGYAYCGQIKCVDIGIPSELKERMNASYEVFDENYFKYHLPERKPRSNKGSYGKILLIGGQKSMAGAIMMAAKASMKVGAGVVTVAVPECIYNIVEAGIWEAMTLGFEEEDGKWSKEGIESIKKIINDYDAIAVGPGMGRTSVVEQLMGYIVGCNKPCIIDADGLYGLKPHLEKLKHRKAMTILTPHPGELSYLTNQSIEDIMSDSVGAASLFANKYNVTLVLKTERTIVAEGDCIGINKAGNTGLAKGGSGDVLTGMMVGFMGQMRQEVAFKIAGISVYGHGRAAELVAKEKSVYSMTPTDLFGGIEKLFIS